MADVGTLGKYVPVNPPDLVPVEPKFTEQPAMLKGRLWQVLDLIVTQAKPCQVGTELEEIRIDHLKFEIIEPELGRIIAVYEGLGVY